MGFKTSLLVYTSGDPAELLRTPPPPDPGQARALVAATHPGWTAASGTADGTLSDDIHPSGGSVYAGSFPGIDVLRDREVMIDYRGSPRQDRPRKPTSRPRPSG
jgi:hypothetical protein